jgi:hypothetical protein
VVENGVGFLVRQAARQCCGKRVCQVFCVNDLDFVLGFGFVLALGFAVVVGFGQSGLFRIVTGR